MKKTFNYLALGLLLGGLTACTTTGTENSGNGSTGAEGTSATDAATANGIDTGETTVTESTVVEDPEAGLDSVFYFEFDKSSLTAATRRNLDAYAVALKASPRNVRLEGHADERGTREYNIALGERRAKSVADYLIASGVRASNLETISYGEERPVASASNSSAWSQNRRVELK